MIPQLLRRPRDESILVFVSLFHRLPTWQVPRSPRPAPPPPPSAPLPYSALFATFVICSRV